jgi:hypothetical protein
MRSTPSCTRGAATGWFHDSPRRAREAGDLGLIDGDVVKRGEFDAVLPPPMWSWIVFFWRPKPPRRDVGEFVNGRSVGCASVLVGGSRPCPPGQPPTAACPDTGIGQIMPSPTSLPHVCLPMGTSLEQIRCIMLRRSLGSTPDAKPSPASRQPERFFAHSQRSTGPSQRLFIGEYSRRCCGRREESSNNGLATHAGSYSHDTDTIRSSLEPVADEPNAGGFEQLMNHTLRLTGKGTKSSAQKTWTAAWWLASAVLQAPPPCVPRLEPMNNR